MRSVVAFLLFFLAAPVFAAVTYFCPMRCEKEKVYEKPGTCPICKMHLEKGTPERSKTLNTIDFRVDIEPQPELVAGQSAKLNFIPRHTKDNAKIGEYEADGTPQSVVLVSQDLGWFSIEPLKPKEGEFVLETNFPSGGNYLAYFTMTPRGERKQVFPIALQVKGESAKEKPLGPPATKIQAGEYEIRWKTSKGSPSKIKMGEPVQFHYTISKKGKPVALESTGAARAVTISEDTTRFPDIHVDADRRSVFHTTFPKAGSYKVWVEVKPTGADPFWIAHSVGVID